MKKKTSIYAVLASLAAVVAVAAFLIAGQSVTVTSLGVERSALEPGGEPQWLADRTAGVPGMELAAESDTLGLYVHPQTAEVAVMDRRSGHMWYSNPTERDEDGKASPFEKEMMSSQFSIRFRDSLTNQLSFMSFADSVAKGQFVLESIDNGVRITYSLGDMSLGVEAMPKYISVARFEEKVLSKLSEEEATYVYRRYYPLKENPDVMERLDEVVKRELVLKKMLDAFKKAGYTEDDLAADNAEHGIETQGSSDKPGFVVPLEFRLDGERLAVTLLSGLIEEAEGYYITSIDLLRHFGAAAGDQTGYMLVPDGTGALIYFNNGKLSDEAYTQAVYGADQNDNSGRRGQIAEAARLPVFGLKAGDSALLAVIEQGDALASISADVSGKLNSYNYVYSSFQLRAEDMFPLMTAGRYSELPIFTPQLYPGDIRISYSFLYGEAASYSGMAALYQGMLLEQGKLTPLQPEAGLPLYVDMIGSAEKRAFFLGVPYESNKTMTSFDEAAAIARLLAEQGAGAVHMRYLGWFNDGIYHEPPHKVSVERSLGGRSGLAELAAVLEAQGGRLYPDAAFQHVYHNTLGFSPPRDASRFVTREVALRYPYNPSFNVMDMRLGEYYLLSPVALPRLVDGFADGYGKLGLDGAALRDLGDLLHSDGRRKRVVYREEAKHVVAAQLGKLADAFPQLMLTGGNAYALPYARQLIDAPMETSGFNIADEQVPFFQMVIHGYIDYAGGAVNVGDEQNVRTQTLRMLELGAAPRFVWMNEPSSALKSTKFHHLYSAHYRDWLDEAVAMYSEVNAALADVRTERIIEHIIHRSGVKETKYENGKSIIVNYSSEPVTVNGVRVEASDYAVVGGGNG